jgi:GT2 family glycosyltransferase
MSESVSIIILNYNGAEYIKDCFTSVLSQTYSDFELIVYDNNSYDDSVRIIEDSFKDKRIRIIKSEFNNGFAGGNNIAVTEAHHDLVVLLNNDTVVDKYWLEKLVYAVRDKNVIASSYVITEGVPGKYYETNGSVSYLMYNIMNIFPDIEDEFYPNGASLIFRKSETGLPFDPDFFMYSEDLYLGLKARFMGMKIKFVKDSVVYHKGSGQNKLMTYYQERNRLMNLYLFFSLSYFLKVLPLLKIVAWSKLLVSFFSNKYSFCGLIRAYFWIFFNFQKVLKKRKELVPLKKIDESEIIKYMTSKLINEETLSANIINKFSYIYSRIVGLKPFEYYNSGINSV